MKRRRYLIDDSMYPVFITTTIVNWIPVFSERPIAAEALSLFELIKDELNIIVYGYVLMPDHIHVIIRSSQKGDISVFMRKWKSRTAYVIRDFSERNHPRWIDQFEKSAKEHNLINSQTYQIWQPRFDEKAVRDDDEFIAKLNYIHGNPLKHNLVGDCGDYPYSSYADYAGGRNEFVTVQCGHNEL